MPTKDALELAKRDFETLTESVDIEADIPGRISAITKALTDPPAKPEDELPTIAEMSGLLSGEQAQDILDSLKTPSEKAPCKTCRGTKVKRVPRDRQFPEHWMEIPCPDCQLAKDTETGS